MLTELLIDKPPIDQLQPTALGVDTAITDADAEVARGYYRERIPRMLGLRRRTAASARAKYDRIAGQYQAAEARLSPSSKMLAFVGDEVRFVSEMAYLDYYRRVLANTIARLGARSVLEVGAGELNTLLPVVQLLVGRLDKAAALDISEKRLAVGRAHDTAGLISSFITASADRIPLPDGSYDVIFTTHCLEQSPEILESALREFVRVASRYILLAEPAYELAHSVQRRRIRKMGYVRGIPHTAKRLGLNVVSHQLMPVREYLNGTAITLIELAREGS